MPTMAMTQHKAHNNLTFERVRHRLRINMHVCAHQPFQARSCQPILIIASIITPSEMPLIDSDPPDYRYVYILIQMRNFSSQILVGAPHSYAHRI